MVRGVAQQGAQLSATRLEHDVVECGEEVGAAMGLAEQGAHGAAEGGGESGGESAEKVQQVVSHIAGVGKGGAGGQSVLHGVKDQVVLGVPTPIQRGLTGTRPGGDALHGETSVSGVGQLAQHRGVDRLEQLIAAAPGSPATVVSCHPRRSSRRSPLGD